MEKQLRSNEQQACLASLCTVRVGGAAALAASGGGRPDIAGRAALCSNQARFRGALCVGCAPTREQRVQGAEQGAVPPLWTGAAGALLSSNNSVVADDNGCRSRREEGQGAACCAVRSAVLDHRCLNVMRAGPKNQHSSCCQKSRWSACHSSSRQEVATRASVDHQLPMPMPPPPPPVQPPPAHVPQIVQARPMESAQRADHAQAAVLGFRRSDCAAMIALRHVAMPASGPAWRHAAPASAGRPTLLGDKRPPNGCPHATTAGYRTDPKLSQLDCAY